MRTLARWGVVLGVVIFMAGVAEAQQPGGGKGRGGRGGPGMGGGVANLLGMEVVQKDLNLEQDQIDKAKTAIKEVTDKYQSEMAELRNLQGEERMEKGRELNKKVTDETLKALASVLKPEQIDRLKQIQLQQRGAQAFNDAEVQKSLKLTDEQKEKIKTINDDAGKEMREMFQGGGARGPEAAQKMNELRKATGEKVMSVLTPEQKETWKTMTGKHIDLPMGGPRRARG